MSVLNRLEQELQAIADGKRSITTALRFTKAELEQLDALAVQRNTTKAEIIRTALRVVYNAVASEQPATNNSEDEIDF